MNEQPRRPDQDPPASDRLDSWKEIAAYLDHSVRTVQLWEKEDGLAVYRHPKKKKGTVYAYRSELDAWWNNGRVRLEQEGDRAETLRPRWRHLVLAVVVPTLLLMAVLAGWYYPQWLGGVGEDGRGAVADASAIVLRHSPEPQDAMLIGKPSRDGRYLPYADVDGDLAVFEFATEETHRLTNERPADDSYDHAYFSAISPDSEQVAYAWFTYDGKFMDLRVIGMDGSEPRVVYQHDDLAYIEFLDWAPDGEHLLARFVWRDTSDENEYRTLNRSEIALVSVTCPRSLYQLLRESEAHG